ncbi:FN3 associated domain-containing protein [Cohnella yongneupensis]|uniref:FN3 associated domain-containing protein n=1 Tax=Cohnella yongneupensis TaxID=425006 RepID=A0ABW0QV23_9BACL
MKFIMIHVPPSKPSYLVSSIRLNAAFSFSTNAAEAAPIATKTSADFTDLKDLDAATKAKFDALISAGVFDGVSDTTFGLKDEMNRAQFVKVAALITGLEVNKDLKTSSFSDVKANDAANGYALPYIEALKTAGITDGYGEGTYNPAGKVTKEQLATFLVRVLGKDADAKAKTGTDTTVSNWAQGYVTEALALKLLPNGADGKFGGQANATRDLLLAGAYEAKAQYVSPGKVSVTGASQVGVKKINVSYNKPVDSAQASLSISKGEGAQIEWAADKKGATLTFPKNLVEGDYTITLSGLDAAGVDKTTATLTVTAEQATKIEFTSTSDTVAGSKAVTIPFKAINQFGETMQDLSKFVVNATVPAAINLVSSAVIADTSSKLKDDRISITVSSGSAGVSATKIFTVGASEVVAPVVSTPSVVATPTASVPSGTAVTVGTSVSLSAAQGATIYYTTDNSEPSTSNGTVYSSSPITITDAMTIKAIAVKSGMTNSGVMTASYTLKAATPTASIPSGTAVTAGTSVSLFDTTQGATIYYTTDGSTPSVSSTVYSSSPIVIGNAVTIKAIAAKRGMTNSDVMTASYTITVAQVATPTALEADSSGMVLVTLNTTPSDATIYYTTDGIHDPSTNPQNDLYTMTYNGPFLVPSSTTVKAIAVKNGMANSSIMTHQTTLVPTPVLAANSLAYIGVASNPSHSLLKLTFSKDVDETSAEHDYNYMLWIGDFLSMYQGSVFSATRGGDGHKNEVTLEVESLASLDADTIIKVQVHNVRTEDLLETIGSGNNIAEFPM